MVEHCFDFAGAGAHILVDHLRADKQLDHVVLHMRHLVDGLLEP